MAEMQRIIDAEKSDLFDVLANVAYALPPLTREERATRAKVAIHAHFNSKQQAFLEFVLAQYVESWGAGIGSAEVVTLAEAQIQQRHRRRSGRLGQAGRDRTGFLRVPEIPLPAKCSVGA